MSASISVSEEDFALIAGAALDAKDSGDSEAAKALDKMARRINLALSIEQPTRKLASLMSGAPPPKRTWRNMPSVLDIEDDVQAAMDRDRE